MAFVKKNYQNERTKMETAYESFLKLSKYDFFLNLLEGSLGIGIGT